MTEQTTGVLLYAVVPADVEPTADAKGLRDAAVSVLPHGDIAAMVSEVPLDQPLGKPADLRTYQQLLDGTATVAPVLPIRFGTVFTDPDAVTELLTGNHDVFHAALSELEGLVEYAVRSRYHDQVVLAEVVEENPEVASLREQIAGQDEQATLGLRTRLGEMVTLAVEAKRNADTQRVVELLEPFAERLQPLPPAHEDDAANVAALVRYDAREEFVTAVGKLADEWSERASVRLFGPLAPYDFATLQQPGG